MFSIVRKPGRISAGTPSTLWNEFDPFRVMENLLRYEGFPEAAVNRRTEAAFAPHFDVKETKDSFLFKVDLPGVKEEDVEISVTGNRLSISGKRDAEEHQEGDNFYLVERNSGSFTRTFTLPESADTEKVKASLKDGVLTLVLPKRTESQPRRISLGKAS